MTRLKQYLLHPHTLVFIFCLAVIIGPAISTLLNYELHVRCTDCYDYKGVAEFDFEQSAVRRYRVIVPFAAAAINNTLGNIIDKTTPEYFHGDFSLAVSFFIINMLIMCLYGVIVYRFCIAAGVSTIAALAGLLMVLTCRWTSFWAAMPMVDSLYCLVTALMLLAMQLKNDKLLILAILLGPFAKEAFIFFVPVILFYCHMPRKKMLLYFLLSGILVFTYRYLYELYAGLPVNSGGQADLGQVNYFKRYWAGLFTPKGLYKIVSNFGLWALLPLFAFLYTPRFKEVLRSYIKPYMMVFVAGVFVHMLFGAYERHFYLAMPVMALFIALAADALMKQSGENRWQLKR